MMDGVYKNYLNAIGYKQLNKGAEIPDVRLCIGDSERLEHIPVMLFKTAPVKQGEPSRELYNKVPYEKIGLIGDYTPISNEDFCHEFDLGTPLKGVV